jgi:hypothetical protein
MPSLWPFVNDSVASSHRRIVASSHRRVAVADAEI